VNFAVPNTKAKVYETKNGFARKIKINSTKRGYKKKITHNCQNNDKIA
jgi:hypothetical protein